MRLYETRTRIAEYAACETSDADKKEGSQHGSVSLCVQKYAFYVVEIQFLSLSLRKNKRNGTSNGTHT